ncbi:RNA polymerase sigma factor [Actinomadura sp. WMMA1423]|uniref:RNA polymerase sigma factor n=1 Tax=Actinomadura sp. WMMA1423 TaxID=2591108 RepID=UPI0011465D25|nr:RNA polymerase sigma factor [Actinomadura sp. WMMA1423]
MEPVASSRRTESGDDPAEIIRSSRHEPERFGLLFDLYAEEIHRYVSHRLGADLAEDVVAETFLAAFRHRSRYDAGRAPVRGWLFGIATKLIGKHRRAEIRELRALARIDARCAGEGHEDRVAEKVSAAALHPSLSKVISTLPRRDRDVLLLVALAGLSHAEVAAALGIPFGTVGSRLNRVRKKLRAALGEVGPASNEKE